VSRSRERATVTACVLLAFAVCATPARSAAANGRRAEDVAKRVAHVFAGFNDFMVKVHQRFRNVDGEEAHYEGRVYFKRDKKFRLNFGHNPPFLIHGCGPCEIPKSVTGRRLRRDAYWVYEKDRDGAGGTVTVRPLDEHAPVHPLLQVFAAADHMVRALRHYFNVDEFTETTYTPLPTGLIGPQAAKPQKIPAYKLVLTLKPERAKEMREKAGNKLVQGELEQTWTFLVDKAESLPRRIRVDFGDKRRYTFDFHVFHQNVGLSDNLFRVPPGKNIRIKYVGWD
jgi:outer membrane lipoprotein-sorting protein